MSKEKRITRIINDPVGQFLVGISLIAYLFFLNTGNNLFLLCSITLDVLLVARVVQIAVGKDYPLGAGVTKVLACLDFISFLVTIYLLVNMEFSSHNVINTVLVFVAAAILVIMAVAGGITYFTKK